jgi:hypothetical protein
LPCRPSRFWPPFFCFPLPCLPLSSLPLPSLPDIPLIDLPSLSLPDCAFRIRRSNCENENYNEDTMTIDRRKNTNSHSTDNPTNCTEGRWTDLAQSTSALAYTHVRLPNGNGHA